MKINQWFIDGCDYDQGVALYTALPKARMNLVRLFKLKFSTVYHEKLKYELSKYKEVTVETILVATQPKKVNPQVDLPKYKINIHIDGTQKTPPEKSQSSEYSAQPKTYKPLLINELPVALHPTYIKQKQEFATVCSLKIQLNALAPEQEQEALKLCIEIEELFDSIERAWKVFDHYKEHNTILEVATNDFSDLSPAQLLQRRNQLRSRFSKEKTKISNWNTALKTATTKALTTKLSTKIERASEKKIQLETDIARLSELINK